MSVTEWKMMMLQAPQTTVRTMLAGVQGSFRKVKMGVVGGCNHHLGEVCELRLLTVIFASQDRPHCRSALHRASSRL